MSYEGTYVDGFIKSITQGRAECEAEVERLRTREQVHLTNIWERDGEIERLTAALRGLVEAWDSLPAGDYTPSTISQWLNGEKMKHGIATARAALGEGKP